MLVLLSCVAIYFVIAGIVKQRNKESTTVIGSWKFDVNSMTLDLPPRIEEMMRRDPEVAERAPRMRDMVLGRTREMFAPLVVTFKRDGTLESWNGESTSTDQWSMQGDRIIKKSDTEESAIMTLIEGGQKIHFEGMDDGTGKLGGYLVRVK